MILKMQSSRAAAILLCFTTWMSLVYGTHGLVKSCCVQWSKTRIPLERVINYTIQSEDTCRIRAVLIQTRLGKTLCSNPGAEWTKRAIQKVDNETKALQEKRQNEEGSESDVTPTASPASKNTPQKNSTVGADIKEGGAGS
ncbi:lymphotactin-like [Archocentrus centrarchus]|uniref:lymphotactin-like n=1 Tax=Archocentrus centrarchus TaxID=63155 RepID=UPI0011EA0BA2|nr:lymphotactin-like [Archocentrus centrarchus]